MATNVVKNIKCESFEGQFTGMITINLTSEVDGNIITEDGIFGIGKTTKVRTNVKYLMAILRNMDIHGAAISAWLDSLKAATLPMRQAAWALALQGQEIDIEPMLQEPDENHSEQWYSHEIVITSVSEPVLNAAYAVMARVLDPTLTAVEAREIGKLYRQTAEAEE